jgi:glycosyltransferase involved in cell wall biosynthesis/GT2 family glycosyltransferase
LSLDVVVVSYQSARHLDACLASVPVGATVTVVDNNSTDASAAVAASRGAVVVQNQENRGFAAAANQGARLGAADLLLFLNPDAVLCEDCAARLSAALAGDPSAAVAGPRLVTPSGEEQRAWWPFPSAARSWIEATGLHHGRRSRASTYVPFVVGACFLVRRSVFEALGGFDEAFWLYGEEADFCRRARDAGWRVRYVPDAVACHAGGASREAAGIARVQEHFLLGTDRFIAKHAGRPALVSHRVALLAGSAARVAALVGRHHDPTAALRRQLVRRQLRVLLSRPTALVAPPETAPPVDRETSPATSSVGAQQLVVCSLEAWDDIWRRNQFLVRELLAADGERRILFVEPPADVVLELRRGRLRLRDTGLRPIAADGRLWALRPRKVLPRVLGPWADRSLRRQVRTAATTLGFDHPTLWVNDTTYAALGRVTGWPMLYDVTDDWLEVTSTRRAKRRARRREQQMLDDARVVVACSPALVERRGARRSVRLIPNAVDADHFQAPQPRPADLPDGRYLVYVGTLHPDRLDVDLVVALARSVATVQLVLVGPDALDGRSRAQLAAEPNVTLLGGRPYDAVPGYLQHAALVVVPHLVTPFTESLDPIKGYEILGAGTPAVVTPAAGLRDLPAPVHCVERQDFVSTVQQLLDQVPARTPRPVPTWADRAAALRQALADAEAPRGRLSVVYLDHCGRLSGGEISLQRLLGGLSGIDAHVILAEDGPLRSCLEAMGIRCEVLPLAPRANSVRRGQVDGRHLPVLAVAATAVYTVRLARRLRHLRPDLVHTNSLKASVYGSVAGRLAGVPVVWHVRDRIAADYLPRQAVALLRAMVRTLPAAVIANSESTGKTIVAGHPTVVYDSTSGQVIQAVERRRGPLRVAMVGRLAPWKGQHIFLEAFGQAFGEGDEEAVVVGAALFGEEEYETSLRRLASQLGVAERVRFVGFQEDVNAVLEGCDVLVHASVVPEPFGQVVIEAMAAGVPVVAAGAGGPCEVIDDNHSGLLFPPGDVAALVAALRRLRDDESLRRRLAANGARRAQDFSPRAMAAQVSEVYRRLLDRRQR